MHHLFLIPVIIFAIITYLSAFKDGKPVCEKYIENTYLYVVTYLFLLCYFVAMLMHYKVDIGFVGAMILLVAFLLLTLVIVYMPAKYVVAKNLLGLLYIFLMGLVLQIAFAFAGSEGVVFACSLALVLFITLSIFAFRFQDMISSKFTLTFVIVFFVMIIADLIIGLMYPGSWLEKLIILGVLMMVCYIVLVRTKSIIDEAKKCEVPDYVKESTGLILGLVNIITLILDLKRGKVPKIK